MIIKLQNTVQNYEWGCSRSLAELLGIANPHGHPQAEIWLGAHPKAPSLAHIDGRWQPLDAVIAADPEMYLGIDIAQRHGSLPFLLKVLAAARPLSIQVHPSHQDARSGFAKEHAQGICLTAANRNYRDANPKPETIFPLTEFNVLCGLRNSREIADGLAAACPDSLAAPIAALRRNESVPELLATLLHLADADRRNVLQELQVRLETGANIPEADWIRRIHSDFPDDIAVLSPLIMRRLTLQPGQSMHNPPGVLHAWLSGTTIEIMANSDNVLRAGLTPKYIDRHELMQITDFMSPPPQPTAAAGCEEAGWYQLQRLTVAGEAPLPWQHVPAILLVLSGTVTLQRGRNTIQLQRGDSVFLPPGGPISVTGKADLVIAGAS